LMLGAMAGLWREFEVHAASVAQSPTGNATVISDQCEVW
jgi:hypothetical protein